MKHLQNNKSENKSQVKPERLEAINKVLLEACKKAKTCSSINSSVMELLTKAIKQAEEK